MKRRQFLIAGFGFVAVLSLGGIAFGPMAARHEIAARGRSRLSFLKLDAAGVDAFAKDQVDALLAKRPTWNRLKYHFLSVFSKSFTRWQSSTDHRTRTQRMEDGFAATYLLSSDFFVNESDETRTIQYLSFYDPMRACGNPFARPAIDKRAAA